MQLYMSPALALYMLLLVIISRIFTKPTKLRIMAICIERVGPPLMNGFEIKNNFLIKITFLNEKHPTMITLSHNVITELVVVIFFS